MTFKKPLLITAFSALFITGCASGIKKAQIEPNTDAKKLYSELVSITKDAYNQQADVLAPDDFKKSQYWLTELKEDIADKEDQEDLIENAAYARAYLDRALVKASDRKGNYMDVLDARKAAIESGARKEVSLVKKLRNVDADFIDETDNFEEKISPEDFSQLQKAYLAVETKAVQATVLGKARKVVKDSVKQSAKSRAPKTLYAARKDLKAAENLIASNPRAPDVYSKSVDQAMASTLMLSDVMKVISENGSGTPEKLAITLVNQQRKIGEQDNRIGTLRGTLDKTKQSMAALDETLKSRNQDLTSAKSKLLSAQAQVEFQRAIERVGNELSEKEAEVYQQGNKLIIRLKKMNFRVGQFRIPEKSQKLLGKVNNIIQELNASELVVHGHTDSTGSEKTNRWLSSNRAKSVAKYFESNGVKTEVSFEGYGSSKPLAPNDSAKGRALNRRVDVVITAK